jgi:hypothetical protein
MFAENTKSKINNVNLLKFTLHLVLIKALPPQTPLIERDSAPDNIPEDGRASEAEPSQGGGKLNKDPCHRRPA